MYEGTNRFKIERGVKQGDTLSSNFFAAVLELVFKDLNWNYEGMQIDGKNLNNSRFVDDIVLVANNLAVADEMANQQSEPTGKVVLS